jgi:hypothetical protein
MRYAWLGATRKGVLRDVVSSSVAAWLQDWCLQPAAIEVDVAERGDALWQPDDCLIWLSGIGRGRLFVAMRRKDLGSLGNRLVLSTAQSDDMSHDLACAALQGLAEKLTSRAGQTATAPVERWEEAWPEAVRKAEWGALALAIALDDIQAMVVMDRAVADAMVPVRPEKRESLTRVADALGSIRVPLSAVLDFGSVSAVELADLQIGEVLVSEKPVKQPIAVQTGHRHLFDANLVHQAGHFALVAFPSNQELS